VAGGWRKLHNEELHVACMGEMRNAYKTSVGYPEAKRPLGRPKHRWEDNIRMDLREIGWQGVNWILLALDRDWWQAVLNIVMNHQVPGKMSFLTI
jgi:hypothetical protein